MKHLLLLLFLLPCGLAFNQTATEPTAVISAQRINSELVIDGKLSEKEWKTAPEAHSFTQLQPYPGNEPRKRTEVRMLYDDNAVYISAICFDDPDSVSKVLSIRDDYNPNLDIFNVYLDTYNDDQNGFSYGVSSMGVQQDAKICVDEESLELNMVWNSAVVITEDGWQLEMRIPYSALRFPKIIQNHYNFSIHPK